MKLRTYAELRWPEIALVVSLAILGALWLGWLPR